MLSPPSPAEPWIHDVGARRGRYEVTQQLARGTYGEVYAVRDESGQLAAMKLLRLVHEQDRRAAKRALLEAKLVRQIDHLNVIRYRDAFVDRDGAVVLVTEYLAGRPLRAVIREGAQPVERALHLGRQLADAAAAVHAVGAVHRDIKPENVFVVGNDVVKLFDFGLAASEGITLKTTRPVGTPRYMAPDQLAYQPSSGARPDPRWDVYAIGLILFELFAGTHAFDLDPARAPRTGADIVDRQLHAAIPALVDVMPTLPRSLSDTVARAVDKRPEHRLASAALLATELAAARVAWLASRGDAAGLTAELRRLSTSGIEEGPESIDGPTLERPWPQLTEARAPATERIPIEPARTTGRFGTERIVPHFDPAALAARNPKPTRNQ